MKEMSGQRDILAAYGGVNIQDITGLEAFRTISCNFRHLIVIKILIIILFLRSVHYDD